MKANSEKPSQKPLLRPETAQRLAKLPKAEQDKVLNVASKVLAHHLKARGA